MDHIPSYEQLLKQCEKDAERLQAMAQELQQIEAQRKILARYYDTQYLQDVDELSATHPGSPLLNQDSIWNVLEAQYHSKIELLKTITASI